MRNRDELRAMGADTDPLYSGIDELETAYEDLSVYVNKLWGPQNSFRQFNESRQLDFQSRPDYKHRELVERDIPQADFYKEMLRMIRRTRILINKYPLYEAEIKVHLSRWLLIHIEVTAAAYADLLLGGEPMEKIAQKEYNYAFGKLKTAIDFYNFLQELSCGIPSDFSTRWKLRTWIEQLIQVRPTRERLGNLLKQPESFGPSHVDALLLELEVITPDTRKWKKTKAGKGGNQSAFPAAYAAMVEKKVMAKMPATIWAPIFREEYDAQFSDTVAERATNTDSSVAAYGDYYYKAIEWLDKQLKNR